MASRTQISIEETVKRFLRKYLKESDFEVYSEAVKEELQTDFDEINQRLDDIESRLDDIDETLKSINSTLVDHGNRIHALEIK